jgi:HK97 family phage major capsid protein
MPEIDTKIKSLATKADHLLTTFTDGKGLLLPKQNESFIDLIQDEPTLIKEVTMHRMTSPIEYINKIDLSKMILRPGRWYDGTPSGTTRALAANERYTLEPSRVELATIEVISEARISYEVLEDVIERDEFEKTVLRHTAAKWARDLERIILLGDTAGGYIEDEVVLNEFDGVLKLVTSKTVDALQNPPSAAVFGAAIKALTRKYDSIDAKWYLSHSMATDIRVARSNRETGLGDANLIGTKELPILGRMAKDIAYMPTGTVLLGDPRNIILGVQRNISLETDKDISRREHIFVTTGRFAVQLFDEKAMVKITNIAPSTITAI